MGQRVDDLVDRVRDALFDEHRAKTWVTVLLIALTLSGVLSPQLMGEIIAIQNTIHSIDQRTAVIDQRTAGTGDVVGRMAGKDSFMQPADAPDTVKALKQQIATLTYSLAQCSNGQPATAPVSCASPSRMRAECDARINDETETADKTGYARGVQDTEAKYADRSQFQVFTASQWTDFRQHLSQLPSR
jgi:hypothetical protein